jgi:glutaredoxin
VTSGQTPNRTMACAGLLRARWFSLALTLGMVLSLLLGGEGCKGKPPPSEEGQTASAPNAPVVKDSSEGLLFTWIDDKGEFHIVEKTADVPLVGRDSVRVVDPTTYDGEHPDKIFVADLRVAGADGTYPVKVTTRSEFDALAEARRAKNGTTLANAGHPGEPVPGGSASAGIALPGAPPLSSRPTVIIYGASWCSACHEAAAYLKRKGVNFVEKDIEVDPNAAREMQAKLAHAGKRGGSIPVIDVRGKVMVGFNQQEVDSALGEAL